ncbi:hypothetical protein Pint_17216 [Pistacia integerrima]|uniref:Uncharacterized protein n=1 Tax=Pistacia integerrima TaxID=434235 RepID=A0ACC0YVU7_9ROSI|nr:hypothetical protein Pint_17216 [Pistacia integerrima]
MDMPGLGKDDVKVTVETGSLVVKAGEGANEGSDEGSVGRSMRIFFASFIQVSSTN